MGQIPRTETESTQLSSRTAKSSVVSLEPSFQCPPIKPKNQMRDEMPVEPAQTWREMMRIWPYHTFLIVLMEFCITLTGLHSVLNLYFINVLQFSQDKTTIFFSGKAIIYGFFSLAGSFIADSYLGKFRAILFGSMIFLAGKLLMSTATFMPIGSSTHPVLDLLAIAIIMIGASFMSPCVSPFGGDQFQPGQERMISVFYSVFYAAINVGSIVSNLLMPILRSKSCLGKDSCYPLSFGVSTTGMLVATVIFIIGSRWYKKQPPQGNIFKSLYNVIQSALANKVHVKKSREHWLDYYFDNHVCAEDEKCVRLWHEKGDVSQCEKTMFVDDIKSLLRLLVMFLPMPMFWALYDQQYTVWVNQALQMDCRLWGDWLLLPDQMQIVNPVLIIVFIFVFQTVIYPTASLCFRLTPLRKMVAGGLLAVVAFLVSAAVQVKVNPTLPELPKAGHAFVSVVNTLDKCAIRVTYEGGTGEQQQVKSKAREVPANWSLTNDKVRGRSELFHVHFGPSLWTLAYEGEGCANWSAIQQMPERMEFPLAEKTIYALVVTRSGAFFVATDPAKPTGGTGEFSMAIVTAFANSSYSGNLVFCRVDEESVAHPKHPCDPGQGADFYAYIAHPEEGQPGLMSPVPYWRRDANQTEANKASNNSASLYSNRHIRPGSWKLYFLENNPEWTMSRQEVRVAEVKGVEFEMREQGGAYLLVLTGSEQQPRQHLFQVVPPNSVSILWQLPQIGIISAAEILVSITGLEFAYSQSGPSMKTIAHSLWAITGSIGSLIIISLTLLRFENLAVQALVCAGAMFIDVIFFALLAIFYYEYRNDVNGKKKANLRQSTMAVERKLTLLGSPKGNVLFEVPDQEGVQQTVNESVNGQHNAFEDVNSADNKSKSNSSSTPSDGFLN